MSKFGFIEFFLITAVMELSLCNKRWIYKDLFYYR